MKELKFGPSTNFTSSSLSYISGAAIDYMVSLDTYNLHIFSNFIYTVIMLLKSSHQYIYT